MNKIIKYPRTFHLPFSPGATSDDKFLKDTNHFVDKEVVVSIKMDGENFSIYNDYCHARSLENNYHWTRTWVKNFHSQFKYLIPQNFRICGENLFAKHSIQYTNLRSFFLVFSIWDGEKCLSYDETMEWCELLSLVHVPVIYKGIYNEDLIKNLANYIVEQGEEGLVVRLANEFLIKDFSKSIAKYVRTNHVQTDSHWKTDSNLKLNSLEF